MQFPVSAIFALNNFSFVLFGSFFLPPFPVSQEYVPFLLPWFMPPPGDSRPGRPKRSPGRGYPRQTDPVMYARKDWNLARRQFTALQIYTIDLGDSINGRFYWTMPD